MTTYPLPVFPTISGGLSWPVKRSPRAGMTRTAVSVSGRVARLALWANPLFDFELVFNSLSSNSIFAQIANTQQALEGFFLQMQGSYGVFAFVDPINTSQVGAPLGTGNGSQQVFTPSRAIDSYNGPPDYITSISGVYINSVYQSSGWSFQYPNQIVFTIAPSNGAVLTITYAWAYAVTFADDTFDFTEFMSNLHEAGSVKLRGVRLS